MQSQRCCLTAKQSCLQVWGHPLLDESQIEQALLSKRPIVVSLVGRIGDTATLSSWDVSSSTAGERKAVVMARLVTGVCARFLDRLEEIHTSGCCHLQWATLPAGLQLAKHDGCTRLKHLHKQISSPRLETLDVTNCRKIEPRCLIQVCGGPAGTALPLRHLHVSWVTQLSDSTLAEFVGRCKKLEALSVRGVAGNSTITAAAANCPDLKGIDVAFSHAVQAGTLWKLLHGNLRLLRCNIRGCCMISNTDYAAISKHMQLRVIQATAGASK